MALVCTIFIPSISTMGTCWNSRTPSREQQQANYSDCCSTTLNLRERHLVTHHDISSSEGWKHLQARRSLESSLCRPHCTRGPTKISPLLYWCEFMFRAHFTDSPLRNFSRSSFVSMNSSSNWKAKIETTAVPPERQWGSRVWKLDSTSPHYSHTSHDCVDPLLLLFHPCSST